MAKETAEKQEKDIRLMMERVQYDASVKSEESSVSMIRKDELKNLKSHVTINIPLIQMSLVNKSMNQFGSKQFV